MSMRIRLNKALQQVLKTIRIIILVLLNQSRSCPRSSINCKAPIQRTNKPKPTASIRNFSVLVSATDSKRMAANTQKIPTGILIKKIQWELVEIYQIHTIIC